VVVSEATCNSAIPESFDQKLKDEGMAREIVHRVQNMRRSAGFDIADHIDTYYQGEDSFQLERIGSETVVALIHKE